MPSLTADDLPVEDVVGADELGDEAGARGAIDRGRRVDLLEAAFIHHHDAVGHGQRLALVVGDVDEGDAELLLQRFELALHVDAQPRVE